MQRSSPLFRKDMAIKITVRSHMPLVRMVAWLDVKTTANGTFTENWILS